MEVRIGTDIVRIERFRVLRTETALDKIFLPSELRNRDPEHLAGIFAAKEAVTKALKIPAGSWQKIEVGHEKTGRPTLTIAPDLSPKDAIHSYDISISHDGEYAIAVAVFLLK